MENENWFYRPGKVVENRQMMGGSYGKVMEFEISLKSDFFREAIVGLLLFFLIHLYPFLYIYYFYLKIVMKFGNFGNEKS